MSLKRNLSGVVAVAALLAVSARANLIVNGSFEVNDVTAPGGGINSVVVTTTPNSTWLSNWTLATTSVTTVAFIVQPAPTILPAHGSWILDFGGFGSTKGVGTLWQDFATTPGATYSVGYAITRYAPSDDGSWGDIRAAVDMFNIVAGVPSGGSLVHNVSPIAPPTGVSNNPMLPVTFTFTATGTTSRILLQDITNALATDHLSFDNITVDEIPEPCGFSLAAMGLAFLLMRRRR